MAKKPKPSLAQRLLGLPSQRYTLPARKDYHSARPALLRIAAESHDTPPTREEIPLQTQQSVSTSSQRLSTSTQDADEDEEDDDDDDATDVFYTPRSSIISDTMTITTPPTSEAGHALYTDQDWTRELHSLVNDMQKPKRPPIPIVPQQRVSRPPTPSIMMSMTTLLEEDEDAPLPPKHPPPSSVIIPSRSSTPPPPVTPHRRTRSHGTSTSSRSVNSFNPPPLPSGPPELPSYGTPAYTSLTVPIAPASTQSLVRSSSISQRIRSSFRRESADLSRSRLAQATMASVEVVGGLASPSHNQPPRLGFTHYRTPPSVPKAGVLVQVWAVGLDAVDIRLLGGHTASRAEFTRSRTQSFGRFMGRTISRRATDIGSISDKDKESGQPAPQVGFIPGRSFVGRVLECGWDVRDEVIRRGEWVIGLLDIRKSGALAEFITVDRHRIQRIPQPHSVSKTLDPTLSLLPESHPSSSASSEAASSHTRSMSLPHTLSNQESPYPSRPPSVSFTLDTPPSSRPSSRQQHRLNRRSLPPPPPAPPPGPDLSELALLPLTGVAAHRAVRTLTIAAAVNKWGSDPNVVTPDGEIPDPMDEKADTIKQRRAGKRRALVLHGHSGTGGLVARMLAGHGWHVCVHAPGSVSNAPPLGDSDEADEADKEHMRLVQERVRGWGVEEVVFDDGGCAADWAIGPGGDGGRGAAVRAVEQLIGDGDEFDAVVDTVGGKEVWEAGERLLSRGAKTWKQFTTTVGDCPARPIPTAKDNFRAGLRSLSGSNGGAAHDGNGKNGKKGKKEKAGKGSSVSYAWVSAAQDVDWEGEDVRDSLGAVLRMALQQGVRPSLDGGAVPFERAAEVFEGREGSGGLLRGGSVVVRVVG
ncbi:hypothetical protein R3P38DRAFT_2757796 [Favolaschia claudopus]|uniref:Enoyl reductase (ER) domain-containing protein n=1 Tax=Favolaschia claudopus TaxID=2862362 RepID=A0AAW0E7A0_9AGAR